MTKRVKIAVTAENIFDGVPRAGTRCPVALAVNRNFCVGVAVGYDIAHIDSDTLWDLPRSAQRFIARFDHDKPVKPFNFFLTQDA